MNTCLQALALGLPASLLLASAAPAADSLRLHVDPDASQVTFDARVNIGIDSFTGTVDAWELDLTVPEGADLPDHAVFTCAVAAMKTGKDKRDAAMEDWLESDRFATVRFELEALRRTPEGLQADGQLTLHGQSRAISIPVTITQDASTFTIRGEITIDYREFDLKVVRMAGFVTVKPAVKVAFVVAGTLQ